MTLLMRAIQARPEQRSSRADSWAGRRAVALWDGLVDDAGQEYDASRLMERTAKTMHSYL